MNKVLEKSKSYEYLKTKYDPTFNDLVRAIEIVKEFIIKNKLIVYGGSAIDYALRLKGDKIYPDDVLTVPDLDFFSPKNYIHAYELADILYAAGFENVRAILASYVRTMRVDVIDNHWIADITFCPEEIFNKLPTLNYNGILIIHPDYQRVDMHNALSFPFDNPPREVIFNRWSKDIKRFNLLDKYYPIDWPAQSLDLKKVTMGVAGLGLYVWTGFGGLCMLVQYFNELFPEDAPRVREMIGDIGATISGSDITFYTFENAVEFVIFDMKKVPPLTNVRRYEPYISTVPERLIGYKNGFKYVFYSTENSYNVVSSVVIGGNKYRISNCQQLLRVFIAMSMITEGKISGLYKKCYLTVLKMIELAEARGKLPDALNITTNVYGRESRSLSYRVFLGRTKNELFGDPLLSVPMNYYPARGKQPPPFDPQSCEFYRETGREISIDEGANSGVLTDAPSDIRLLSDDTNLAPKMD